MMKRLLLSAFGITFGLMTFAQQVVTIYKPKVEILGKKYYHISPKCEKIDGKKYVTYVFDFSEKLSHKLGEICDFENPCPHCQAPDLKKLREQYSESRKAGRIPTQLEPNEIRIRTKKGKNLTTSSGLESGERMVLFEVSQANDSSLVGCPVTYDVLESRKSNILGSEGRLRIRPIYLTKYDGTKVYLEHDDIFARGKNRTNVKVWTSILCPIMWLIAGS